VARLSGSTAEFMSIWTAMMAGKQPFRMGDDGLELRLAPCLPGTFFTDEGTVSFRFLGQCEVTYHNPDRADTFADGVEPKRIVLRPSASDFVEIEGGIIGAPFAEMVRNGEIEGVNVHF
jgi:hypothetical protein